MRPDFANEYASRNDDEIRLLLKERHELIDAAREALDAEVRKRRSRGFLTHLAAEPEVPIEDEDEDEHVVVVPSRQLHFPKVCPRCLAPADATIRIPCVYGSWMPIVDFLAYSFVRYRVPFCSPCAASLKMRRLLEEVVLALTLAGLFVSLLRLHLSMLLALLVACACGALGALVAKLLGLWKRWPAAAIDILSPWWGRERRLHFENPAYEKAFIAQNSGSRRRWG